MKSKVFWLILGITSIISLGVFTPFPEIMVGGGYGDADGGGYWDSHGLIKTSAIEADTINVTSGSLPNAVMTDTGGGGGGKIMYFYDSINARPTGIGITGAGLDKFTNVDEIEFDLTDITGTNVYSPSGSFDEIFTDEITLGPFGLFSEDGGITLTNGNIALTNGTITATNFSGSNTGDETAAGLLTKIKTVDGSGSGLDADTLDAHETSYFVAANGSITGAAKTKITYDAKGLVTSGADATTADIADSSNKRYVTDAQLTVIGNTSGTNTGDQTITLTGAVTGSGTGSFATTLASNVVGTSNITNGTVALADMADMATASLFYRKTAGTGVPEIQTLAQLKTDLGLTGTNSGDQTIGTIATQNSNSVTITGGSITGITDIAIADGGTGSSTASAAVDALGGASSTGTGGLVRRSSPTILGGMVVGDNSGYSDLEIVSNSSNNADLRFYNGTQTSNTGLHWIAQSVDTFFNFAINRYIAGVYQDSPIVINNATGFLSFAKGSASAVATLTDAATIALDASTGNYFKVQITANRTVGAPSNPTAGQFITVAIQQSVGGSNTIAWNSAFRFSTTYPSGTLTTTASRKDKYMYQYDGTDSKWDCMGISRNFN